MLTAETLIEKKRIILGGVLPSVANSPKDCSFNTRCPRKIGDICETEKPPEIEASSGHMIACHIPLEELEAVAPVIAQVDKSDETPPPEPARENAAE